MASTPENTLDTADPGDETMARYGYQHCYGAIQALRMVSHNSNVQVVLCENFEDVIVGYDDGSYVGSQVKTREIGLAPFKANDDSVISSFARFCRLESTFPAQFTGFEFVTNYTFWENSDGVANDLRQLIDLLKDRGGSVKRLRNDHPLKMWVAAIADAAGCTTEEACATICKCAISAHKSAVRTGKHDVLDAASECPKLADRQIATVKRVAARAIEAIKNASSKELKGSIFDLFTPAGDFKAALQSQVLAGKAIRRADVENLINECCKDESTFEPLAADHGISFEDFSKSMPKMVQKMSRGEIHNARIRQMENWVHQVESLYIKWTQKFSVEIATQKLNHLLALTAGECAEAQVGCEATGTAYGSAMFEDLKARVKVLCNADPLAVYNCRPEHLLGAAGMLTNECKVWWSPTFVLAAEGL